MVASGPVIVTGASTGIGAATTKRMVAAGREVITLDVKDPPEGSSQHHHCDLADPSSIEAVARELSNDSNVRYASLLNIAGVPGTVPDELVIAVNTLGLRQLTEALWDNIADRGTVVNVASIAGNNWKKRFEQHNALLDTPDFAAGADWWAPMEQPAGPTPTPFRKRRLLFTR